MTSTSSSQASRRIEPHRWLDLHGDVLFRFALRRVHGTDLAEELVQETLLAALRGVSSFEGRAAEQTWLIGILRHKIIDHFRSKAAARETAVEDLSQHADRSHQEMFDSHGHWVTKLRPWQEHPDDLLENQDFWSTFRTCLERLSAVQADAFVLREIEAMETEEICKVLGIAPSNLWTQLHRGRLSLRRCLDAKWFRREK